MGFVSDVVKPTNQAGTPSASEGPVQSDELFSTELWASLLGTHPAQDITGGQAGRAHWVRDSAFRDRLTQLLDRQVDERERWAFVDRVTQARGDPPTD